MTDRLSSIALFFFSSIFTRKLNAIGISNLPVALQSFADAKKAAYQKGLLKYAEGALLTIVVAAGFLNKWHHLIKANAVLNIAMGVKESIDTRNMKVEEAKRLAEQRKHMPVSKIRQFFRKIKERLLQWRNKVFRIKKPKEEEEDPKKKKKQLVVNKAKALLAGRRDSATDDILWGVFQVSLVFFDAGNMRAMGHAAMVFLLHAFEETFLNDELTWKQKRNKIIWLAMTGYMSGKFFF